MVILKMFVVGIIATYSIMLSYKLFGICRLQTFIGCENYIIIIIIASLLSVTGMK